jgi:hypothetical protein
MRPPLDENLKKMKTAAARVGNRTIGDRMIGDRIDDWAISDW